MPRRLFSALIVPRLKLFLPAFVFGLCLACSAAPLRSEPLNTNQCERAARKAAEAKGIPVNVMRALTRTETGRTRNGQFEPWPWTLNVEGAGRWFSTREEAQKYAFQQYKLGHRSFDLGCFQINFKWHGQAFSSLDQMLDPEKNADYAASFLMKLYEEFGSWPAAAAAYHSRTPEFAKVYRARFERVFANLDEAPATRLAKPLMPGDGRRKDNAFPLLRQGQSTQAALGSLVPVGQSNARGLWFKIQEQL